MGSDGSLSTFFPAKILLFGEYTVINGGVALAIPFNHFQGAWQISNTPAYDWNPLLRFLQANPELGIDALQLERDLVAGAGYVSTIPQGKGLGSSGALVASIFDYYSLQKDLSLLEVKHMLSQMEGFYHGQSSGVDPLVSWLKKPLLLDAQFNPQVAELPVEHWRELERWFLFDSEVSRHSAPLIAAFKQKMQDEAFQKTMGHLKLVIHEAIDAYQEINEAVMGQVMMDLSRLQFECLQEMIPQNMRQLWLEGLDTRQFALKLCGAGGGGYFIGYSLKGTPRKILKF